MTNLTPLVNQLLTETHSAPSIPGDGARPRPPSRLRQIVDEFLKEAYRINAHIHSLLRYLQSVRHSYLSTTTPAPSSVYRRRKSSSPPRSSPSSSSPSSTTIRVSKDHTPHHKHFSDQERDSVDSSTATLLRDLSSSIANLSSAETLRQETESSLLRKKYGHANNLLWRWAGGGGALSAADDESTRTPEQERDEDAARTIRTVRESVLWYLRRGLQGAAEVQRGMVEKRIEREREKEKSVLYKLAAAGSDHNNNNNKNNNNNTSGLGMRALEGGEGGGSPLSSAFPSLRVSDAVKLSEGEVADIESQLSPEQLQLFAEENNTMLKHYEDTLSKVRNAEKSLLEISSLQQTLVSHLSTQEEYVEQLVMDAATTHENVGHGNKQLQRAAERRSTAQMVFWGTVGICTWLIVWDAIF